MRMAGRPRRKKRMRRTVSVRGAATLLGLAPVTVRRMIHRGQLAIARRSPRGSIWVWLDDVARLIVPAIPRIPKRYCERHLSKVSRLLDIELESGEKPGHLST